MLVWSAVQTLVYVAGGHTGTVDIGIIVAKPLVSRVDRAPHIVQAHIMPVPARAARRRGCRGQDQPRTDWASLLRYDWFEQHRGVNSKEEGQQMDAVALDDTQRRRPTT